MACPILLDCTLRDGGYYNLWDFSVELINRYLIAMKEVDVDYVELGFRILKNNSFKGPCAFTTDDFIRTLTIPEGLKIGVMVNGSDLLTDFGFEEALEQLFPETTETSPVELVRFACHIHEFSHVLPAVGWLSKRGYRVNFNLMQIADRTKQEVVDLGCKAKEWPITALYLADSMGSMTPDGTEKIINWLREEWAGPIGAHTHDNMGLALQNTLRAYQVGATWLDGTVTGMGRGPGNARTEELAIEVAKIRNKNINLVPLFSLIRSEFSQMKTKCGWGANHYYYLSGLYGIHPTYIQEMLSDARYNDEDVLAVIDHLRNSGGKKFSFNVLNGARNFYSGSPRGAWSPASVIAGRDVLILATGPGVVRYRAELERFIRRNKPLVLALNTQSAITPDLINLRVACHPVRLLADAEEHHNLPQPLVTPASMLSPSLQKALKGKELFDFGIVVEPGIFEVHDMHCTIPALLVMAYALAIVTSGRATRILLAGFDGYPAGDPRNSETAEVFEAFESARNCDMLSITPTTHRVPTASLYSRFL